MRHDGFGMFTYAFKRITSALLLSLLFLNAGFSQGISGVWENAHRFIEFSTENGMRIVLKSYYGFVYEESPWFPYRSVETERGDIQLSILYPGEKKMFPLPAAVVDDALFLQFFNRVDSNLAAGSLEGFWLSGGSSDALRLYRSEPVDSFFGYYFAGNRYYRIRYWSADVRVKPIEAEFSGPSGETLSVPKFLELSGMVYTCVTGTGKTLRNYETGSWTLTDGYLSFKNDNTVYEGTAAGYRSPLRLTVSSDGRIIGIGEPYARRSRITDLDAEILAHNGYRRPPREPLLDFLDLDFRWEDIERIRNKGALPQ